MPLESIIEPPRDGRQSEAALRIARGTRRLLRGMGYSTLTELPLANGRRADIVAVCPRSRVAIVEVKSSVADFRIDSKWMEYRDHSDYLYFAISTNIPEGMMPEDAGLIIADEYGACIVRHPPEHRLAPATRREVLLRFARAAADRLHLLQDPSGRRLED